MYSCSAAADKLITMNSPSKLMNKWNKILYPQKLQHFYLKISVMRVHSWTLQISLPSISQKKLKFKMRHLWS